MNNDFQAPTGGKPVLSLTIEGGKFYWSEEFITGAQLKQLAGLSPEAEIFLAVPQPWNDERILDDDRVNLARPEIEHFYVKKKLRYRLNEAEFESDRQYVQGKKLRHLGNIPETQDIFLSVAGPWDDELIENDAYIDLARPGIEHFYSREVVFMLFVNAKDDSWNKKTITYEEVVKLAFAADVHNPNRVYTVTFKRGPVQNPEGSMVKGDTVFVKNKMIFNVTATDKS